MFQLLAMDVETFLISLAASFMSMSSVTSLFYYVKDLVA